MDVFCFYNVASGVAVVVGVFFGSNICVVFFSMSVVHAVLLDVCFVLFFPSLIHMLCCATALWNHHWRVHMRMLRSKTAKQRMVSGDAVMGFSTFNMQNTTTVASTNTNNSNKRETTYTAWLAV